MPRSLPGEGALLPLGQEPASNVREGRRRIRGPQGGSQGIFKVCLYLNFPHFNAITIIIIFLQVLRRPGHPPSPRAPPCPGARPGHGPPPLQRGGQAGPLWVLREGAGGEGVVRGGGRGEGASGGGRGRRGGGGHGGGLVRVLLEHHEVFKLKKSFRATLIFAFFFKLLVLTTYIASLLCHNSQNSFTKLLL